MTVNDPNNPREFLAKCLRIELEDLDDYSGPELAHLAKRFVAEKVADLIDHLDTLRLSQTLLCKEVSLEEGSLTRLSRQKIQNLSRSHVSGDPIEFLVGRFGTGWVRFENDTASMIHHAALYWPKLGAVYTAILENICTTYQTIDDETAKLLRKRAGFRDRRRGDVQQETIRKESQHVIQRIIVLVSQSNHSLRDAILQLVDIHAEIVESLDGDGGPSGQSKRSDEADHALEEGETTP